MTDVEAEAYQQQPLLFCKKNGGMDLETYKKYREEKTAKEKQDVGERHPRLFSYPNI